MNVLPELVHILLHFSRQLVSLLLALAEQPDHLAPLHYICLKVQLEQSFEDSISKTNPLAALMVAYPSFLDATGSSGPNLNDRYIASDEQGIA